MPPSGREVTLDAELMARFHRLAPQVLRRRDRAFLLRELAFVLQFVLIGAVPIVGTALFGWEALTWLAYVVIGAWLGIFTDVLTVTLLGEPLRRHLRHRADSRFVGLVCAALRSGRTTIPRLGDGADHRPGIGLFFDLVFGAVSTLLIYVALKTELGVDWGALTSRSFFGLSLAAFVLCQIGFAAWQIAGRRLADDERHVGESSAREAHGGVTASRRGRGHEIPVKVYPGARGAGLFMLMFVVLISADTIAKPQRALPAALYVVNGFVVLFGLLGSFGMVSILRENRWLARYLAERQEEAAGGPVGSRR